MKHAPRVLIIILNWNGLQDTIECLDSLKQIEYVNYEIVVVDNGSIGNDAEILESSYGNWIQIIRNPENLGFPEGNNVAIRYAMGRDVDYFLLLNNDTVVARDFLSELVKVAEADQNIGLATSKVYFYHFPDRVQSTGAKVIWWLGYTHPYSIDKDSKEEDGISEDYLERDLVNGTSLLVSRKLIDKIGLLDSFFFFGIEELDYCLRAKRAGFKMVYVPRSHIWHKAGASRAKLLDHPETLQIIRRKQGFLCYKYSYHFFRKHYPFPKFIMPFLFFTVFEATFLIPAVRMLRRIVFQRDFEVIKLSIRTIGNLSTPWIRAPKRSRLPVPQTENKRRNRQE